MALKKVGSFWKSDPGKKHVLRGSSQREAVTIPANAKILVFPNDKGDNPKRPDYTLMIVEEDEAAETQRGEVYTSPIPDEDENSPF